MYQPVTPVAGQLDAAMAGLGPVEPNNGRVGGCRSQANRMWPESRCTLAIDAAGDYRARLHDSRPARDVHSARRGTSFLSFKGRVLNELLRAGSVPKPSRRFSPYARPMAGSTWWNISR